MLLLLSIAALWVGVSSNCLRVNTVGWHSPEVVYKIGDISRTNFTEKHITDSLREIEANTCVNFIESKDAPGKAIDVTIANGANLFSCQYKDGVVQLGSCISSSHFIKHEVAHYLGLFHTFNRPDWRNYLRIKPNYAANLFDMDPLCTAVPIVGFDMGSGMHQDVFNVAETIDPDFASTLGQNVRFPFSDYHSLNWLFNCSGKCATHPKCLNGGYTHPRHCEKCMCNKYFTGDFCETPKKLVKLTCEGNRTYTREAKVMESNHTLAAARKLQDDNFNRGEDMWDIIEAPQGMKIHVDYVSYASAGTTPPKIACSQYAVEINDGDLNMVGKMYCDHWRKANVNGVYVPLHHNFTAKSHRLGLHMEHTTDTKTDLSATFTLLGCDGQQ